MMSGLMRPDDIVPFAMKPIGLKIDALHFFLGDFAAGWIFAVVQSACHFQPFCRRRLGNEMDDGFVIAEGFATPIRRDEGKKAVFDLVPLARPRGEMTDREGQTGFIREGLQLQFPQAQPPAIAPPAVGRNQDLGGRRIEPLTFLAPPSPDGRHRKRSRVVIRPDIDEPGVAPDVVDAIGIGTRHVGRGKIMPTNLPRLFRGKPLLASVIVVADEFFLLRIHRDHGAALRQASFHRGIDVPKLRVAVRMVSPLLRLPVALETVVEPVQKLSDLRMADWVLVPTQLLRNRSRALTNPSQRRLRVAPGLMIDHRFQGIHQPRVRHRNEFAPRSGAANPTFHRRGTLFDFTDAFGNGLARQSARTAHPTHSPIAQSPRFARRHQAPRPFVQQWPHRMELSSQLSKTVHAHTAYQASAQTATFIYLRRLTVALWMLAVVQTNESSVTQQKLVRTVEDATRYHFSSMSTALAVAEKLLEDATHEVYLATYTFRLGCLHRYNPEVTAKYNEKTGNNFDDGVERFWGTLHRKVSSSEIRKVTLVGPSSDAAKDIVKLLNRAAKDKQPPQRALDVEAEADELVKTSRGLFAFCGEAQKHRKSAFTFDAYELGGFPFQILITTQKSGVKGCLVLLAGDETIDGSVLGFYSELHPTVEMFSNVFTKLCNSAGRVTDKYVAVSSPSGESSPNWLRDFLLRILRRQGASRHDK